MRAKTPGSLPISSGNGTNEVTNISKHDKKDNQLGSVTIGEELSDAELILSDADLLSAEQALNFIEDDTKEDSDHSNVSAGSKAQEGSVVEGNECGKEATQDVQAEQEVQGNEEDEKCKEVTQKKNRRPKRSQPRQALRVMMLSRKVINMLSGQFSKIDYACLSWFSCLFIFQHCSFA